MYSQRRWCTAIPVLSALVLMAHGATIKFDQSQTGDYNLQIHLKNIELYAVFDDSGGSDDEYGDLPDYTDSTDGPSKPPAGASSTTAAPPPPSPPPNSTGTSGTGTSGTSPSTSASSTSNTAPAYVLSSSTEAVASSAAALLDPYSPSNSDKIVQMVEALIASNGNTSDMPTDPPPSVASQQQQPSSSSSSSTPPQQQQQTSQSPPVPVALTAASPSNTANRKCGPGYFRDPMGRCRRIRKPHLPFLQMVHTPGVIKSFQPQLRTTEDDSTSKN